MATFVLVHGAWHGSWCWKRVRKALQAAGHEVFTPTLTGLGERSHLNSPSVNLSTHISDVVNLIKWEELSNVVLCGHSYGGCVISGVAEQLNDSIRALVYVEGFVLEDGESFMDLFPREQVEQARLQAQAVGDGWKFLPFPANLLGTNPKDVDWVDAQFTPQPIASFEEPLQITDKSSQIKDVVHILATGYESPLPVSASHERAKRKGWTPHIISCGHEVMLDRPNELTNLLMKLADAIQ
jgi:pimeloyl-ACP methyl ester carboxylesterase